MDHEPGDDYIRRIAIFIRDNEQGLAAAGLARRRRPKASNNDGTSMFNPLGWFATDPAQSQVSPSIKPVTLSFDSHHLFYLLMRMEAVGLDVGSLDVRVENPSRPMNYVNVFHGADRSDTLSLRSFATTISAVSKLSLGSAWWGRPPPPTVDSELKFIFSSFTKLPALRIHAPESRLIKELANDAPNENAIPLDAFKNLQVLECSDVDPRTIIGWDRLAESLRSLTIKRSGLEDVSDIFIGAVMDDQARREGQRDTDRLRRIPRAPPSRQSSFYSTRITTAVPEEQEKDEDVEMEDKDPETPDTPTPENIPKSKQTTELPSLKWAFLRHLCLADNALTFLPSSPLPHLTSLTHLDISSNLLVSIPSGLGALYNLVSLNVADNMIDSVLGIYTMLGGITILNLAKNRLENICGLERLLALERVDLRHNIIEESAEIGRLATLPNVTEVWVEGNPLCELEEGYRIRCFDVFWKEGKSIVLDGSPPGFYEKRYLTSPPPEQMTSSRPVSVALTPPSVPVGSPSLLPTNGTATEKGSKPSPKTSPSTSGPPSNAPSPNLAAVRGRKKRNKRIVDLDGGSEAGSSRSGSMSRIITARTTSPKSIAADLPAATNEPVASTSTEPATTTIPPFSSTPSTSTLRPKSRHSRHYTELAPPSPFTTKDPSFFPPSPSASELDPRAMMGHRRSATMSSKSAKRRARASASVFEHPDTNGKDEDDGKKQFAEAEAFRARIEALRSDMGDGWLKVFNQSHLGSPGVNSG
ncbi:hypothetical protein QCA50_003946 [Cerrena zonata]|uniref:Uncharacterized protein n=1 Tax=Cerrena zonata TaxID=2478898 RepID=A0AAW0GHT9_9APHY